MRLTALRLAAVISSLIPVAALVAPTAVMAQSQTEGAWTPPRSALSSAMPTLAEDTALAGRHRRRHPPRRRPRPRRLSSSL
jgi:hypothetical protein